jgi:hypothetical protein
MPLNPQIIYTNLAAKPKLSTPAPMPEAPAQAPAPQVKRISWGIQGRLHMPATAERPQPRKDDSPSRGGARVERSTGSRSVTPEAPKVRMRYVDHGSRLERLPEQRSLWERLDRHTARPGLEDLTILYWIADAETGKIFIGQAFTTLQHCHEAAVELEHTFAIAQVLDMRSPETMESVNELVREHWLRERVAVVLG